MNIVIPMAGLGSRFAEAGYQKPKPFIDINGKPMVEHVMENTNYPGARFILIGRKEHLLQEVELVKRLEEKYNAHFIGIDKLTEGTACTVLYARQYINNTEPLLIANSDQIIDHDLKLFIDDCLQKKLQGSILCFEDSEMNPKWSFAKINNDGIVTEVKEKQAISNLATVGIYLFSEGKIFVDAAIDMIIENERVNNEFYTCPVYNYAIKQGAKIGTYTIAESAMNGTGTPADLQKFLQKF
jgi:UDP-N-acetylglucosamine diphosphorylase / glucose-1-phosphate thymidylyltransferase / UDP-N-acetylgalactosamine diphosphorylase / glucosamine-1-phosphate N-acetyltransferase / galactosamine-1-phosphate N-acetyltransferase